MRARDPFRGLSQGGILLAHGFVLEQFLQSHQGADAESRRRGVLQAAQFFDFLDVDYAPGPGDVVLHQAQKVHASRQDFRFAPPIVQQGYGLFLRGWASILECAH